MASISGTSNISEERRDPLLGDKDVAPNVLTVTPLKVCSVTAMAPAEEELGS